MYDLNTEKEEKYIKPKKKLRKGNFVIVILIVSSLIASILVYFRFNSLNNELNKYKEISNTGVIEQEKVQQMLDKVSKLMILPDEKPTVATITNTSGLKKENPNFYKNAVDGDILIIYTDKAILYRESENIIVNVAPVFIEPAKDNPKENSNTINNESNVIEKNNN